MPAPSDRPLLKVSFNLFLEDVELFRQRYGQGWTEQVRNLVSQNNQAYLRDRDILDTIFDEAQDE